LFYILECFYGYFVEHLVCFCMLADGCSHIDRVSSV
jgi:hypothetical protein